MIPLQGAQVQSLIGELRSHMLHSEAKKKKLIKIKYTKLKEYIFNSPAEKGLMPCPFACLINLDDHLIMSPVEGETSCFHSLGHNNFFVQPKCLG